MRLNPLRGLLRPAHHGAADRYRYLFVVTYGRSGSTLLTGLLNTIPGYRIAGENGNVLYRLYQADAALRDAHTRHRDHAARPADPWYGAGDWRVDDFRRDLVDTFVTSVLRPRSGDRVLGFKEIRYTVQHMPDLDAFLGFVREGFRGARFVVNHRRPEDVAASGWWADVPDALARIRAADARLRALPADERLHHFDFDAIDDGLANVRALFTWLGENMDPARVRATLARPHSYPSAPAGGADALPRDSGLAGPIRRIARRVRDAGRR